MVYGYQAVYDPNMFDAIDYAAENGFGFVSFDLNVPRFYIDQMGSSELDRIRKYAEGRNVGLAFHTPGDNISLFSDYPSIRKGILEHFSAIIASAERLSARHVVIHTGTHPSLKQANKKDDDFIKEYEEYFSGVLYENLLHLANQTRTVLLCVENYNFTPLTMKVIERLLANSDKLFLTWDIAKSYDNQLNLDAAVEDFMWKHVGHVREAHAHDIIRGFRSHQIIGEGGIDFAKYATLFSRPDVAVTIEVRPREAATLARDRLQALLGAA